MPEAQASEVTQIDEGALQCAAEKIVALNRKSTGHAYELGETFAEAKALVPEKRFGHWLKQFTDYSVRSAWNYISIHEKLQDYREHLLTHAVTPTVMFELAKGEPAQIEAVIARMDAGERIRVKDVKAALGIKPKEKEASALIDFGGMAGLRKIAEIKIEEDSVKFLQLATRILKSVETAKEPLAKKRAVGKGALQDVIVYHCRHAHDLINKHRSIAAAVQDDERHLAASQVAGWHGLAESSGAVSGDGCGRKLAGQGEFCALAARLRVAAIATVSLSIMFPSAPLWSNGRKAG